MPLTQVAAKTRFQFTDTTDIALANQNSSQSNIGAAQTINIPANGFIQLIGFAGRVQNTGGAGARSILFGVRVSGVNYWFGQVNDNGIVSYQAQFLGSGGLVGNYKEYSGLGMEGATLAGFGLDVAAAGIPTGAQSVQLIGGWQGVGCTLKGTVKQSHVFLGVYE